MVSGGVPHPPSPTVVGTLLRTADVIIVMEFVLGGKQPLGSRNELMEFIVVYCSKE